MNKITEFEDLPNDLFLDIFDYLHALDLFMAFSSLNKRISLILSSTQLHVIVSKLHCHYQIEFLSSHLTNHAHQVISLSLEDQLRDFSSVIPFFFKQHRFINLRSCIFSFICSSSKLNRVIQQLKTLTKLQSFQILQSNNISLSNRIKRKLSKTILKHTLSNLRSVRLSFRYDYPYLTTNNTINWSLTSLRILFYGSSTNCSIYRILPILHTYRALRQLHIAIFGDNESNIHHPIAPILPFMVEDNLSVSSCITLFNLDISTECDFDSLSLILRFMPNLRQFIIRILTSSLTSLSWNQLLNGQNWQQLLTNHLLYLDVFNLFLTVFIDPQSSLLDKDNIVHSFDYFSRKYDDWHVTISQSKYSVHHHRNVIHLHALRFSKKARYMYHDEEQIVLGTFNMHSTTTTTIDVQQRPFYYGITGLEINIPLNTTFSNAILPFPPYQNIDSLLIRIEPLRTSLWNTIMKLTRFYYNDDTKEQRERFHQSACLINLNHVTKLEFDPVINLSQLYFIEQILLASPNVVQLTIATSLFLSPSIFDNSSLTRSLYRLQSLNVTTEHVYFSLKNTLKLVQQCPLLIHMELRVYSLDVCLSIVDILLDDLVNLSHLKIYFNKYSLLNNPCPIDYIIEKRRRTFPLHICNRDEIFVNIDGEFLEIYLNGCLICTNQIYYV